MARISDAVDIAAEAAEKIRVLNLITHPSSGWSGLDDPVDVYEVLGALAALADRLQQTTNQRVDVGIRVPHALDAFSI